MKKIYQYFEKLYNENRMTQAFLIGNVVYDDIKVELEKTINDFIFKNNIELEENPDIYIIKTEDGYLSKEKIKELLNNLSHTSQFNNTKLYIIEDCEKMSDTVYNAMLKTLEEPSPGIYAILLTNNIDAVKPTIVSRCQKIFVNSSKERKEKDQNIVIESTEIIENLELKVAIIDGISNAKKVLEEVKNGTSRYHYIEIMNCIGGCIGNAVIFLCCRIYFEKNLPSVCGSIQGKGRTDRFCGRNGRKPEGGSCIWTRKRE